MSQANNKARLTVPRDEARNKLNDRIEKIKEISGRLLPPEALAGAIDFEKRWYEYNRELLATLFTTHHYKDEYAIAAAEHPITQVRDQYFDAHPKDFSIRLQLRIKSQVRTLQSIIDRLELIPEGPIADAGMQIEQQLELLLERFHRIVQQMRSRRQSRPPLVVNDEYDVQYLLHGLLSIFFDDIREEEWVPSYAGKASRMDFLLPDLKTVIEVKKTRPSLTAGVLGDELLIDIARYQQHSNAVSFSASSMTLIASSQTHAAWKPI